MELTYVRASLGDYRRIYIINLCYDTGPTPPVQLAFNGAQVTAGTTRYPWRNQGDHVEILCT